MELKGLIKYSILISLFIYYMLTYHWAYSVHIIQLFTKKKYTSTNTSLITTTPSYKVCPN